MAQSIIINDTNETAARILAVEIHCNAAKGEIRTTVRHDAESFRVGDASDNRSDERVTISERTFPVYAATPGAATVAMARSMHRYTLANVPGVPVQLYGA